MRDGYTVAKAARTLAEVKEDLDEDDSPSAKVVALSSAIGATAGPAVVRSAAGSAGGAAARKAGRTLQRRYEPTARKALVALKRRWAK